MRAFAIALSLTLTAMPVMAGGYSVDLPRLSWPQDDQTTTSTKGCDAVQHPATTVCK